MSSSTTDPTGQSYRVLQNRINTNIEILYKRYENILSLAPLTLERRDAEGRVIAHDKKDKTLAMAEAFQMETHASAMIRAAEDLLALTRSLKEAWIFGQIGGDEDVVKKIRAETDMDAAVVGEKLVEKVTKEVVGDF
ncbi:hypothetical protein EX30DRAFT_361873 [Ascodesmis nigricans]|uniref:Mediator of RNA polymerase II transcription subunit 22 n=1 Tax=Ascodesmis nigricans TaxID=341454 RepID=A0A4S2N408_9PEZI|nr:hypothetical protein EX30DRAFT_361873 [Ascodesmis nigricans]